MEENTQVTTEGTAQGTSNPPAQSEPSAEVTQAREAFTKLSASLKPTEIADILSSNPSYVGEVTKTIRTADIERKAREFAANNQNAELANLRNEMQRLQTENQQRAQRETEALRATMTDAEWNAHQQQQELTKLREERDRLMGTVHQVQEAGARQKYIDWLADKGLDADEDVTELRKATNPEEFLLTAVDRAMAKVKLEREKVDTFEARLAAIERNASGAGTLAATSKSSAGGEMSYTDLQRAYVSNPGDPDIKARFNAAYRERKGKR